MAKSTSSAQELTRVIDELQSKRQTHVRAIEEIDAIFSQYGIRPSGARRRGRPPKALSGAASTPGKRRGRRRRGSFATTGEDSVLNFVAKAGKKGATGAQIVKHWEKEGRGGQAYNTVTKLVKDKRLKRQNLKGQRGSVYTAA